MTAATATHTEVWDVRRPPTRWRPMAWLFVPAPATRLAALRILVGAYATLWATVRLPAHLDHAHQVADRWQPVGLLAPLDVPPVDSAIVGLSVGAPLVGLLFTAGWGYRLVGPLFAVAILALATLDSSWGQAFHTENLLVLHLLILAVAPAAATLAVGHRGTPVDDIDERYGWPLRLTAVVVVLAYVIAGIAKLRIGGLDWLGGDALRHWVAQDNLRKALLGDTYSPFGARLVGHAWLLPPVAVVTLVIELGALVALAGGRWRTAWVVAAWLFHVAVLALMAILFPYQLSGVAFAPFFRLERVADSAPRIVSPRPGGRRPCWAPGSRAGGAGSPRR